ncbi:hypothetical protein [Cytobacillus oceanisediminis]|uniref:hypothetical protein n=1 Tax=Cytobacillus oceanisediminis TaxID=665099 RepID=UPI00207A7BCB|nr:hypothetical protein [Cytobacillus oceanisediminis]USK42265.1 hypothetical protein LIT27_16655 [Cytobacillus oceanisediminis]
MKNNKRIIKLTAEELPAIWTEFMNDTLSILSLMKSVSLAQDEDELKRIQMHAKSIGRSIQDKSEF